jgi:hypothetical protein
MRRTQTLAVAVLSSSMSFAATAGVIYRWEDRTSNPNLGPGTGQMEISDAYWEFGASVTLTNRIGNSWPSFSAPFGVDSFYFAGSPSPGVSSTAVNLHFRPCSLYKDCMTDDLITTGYWEFDLTFGSVLTGSLSANDTNSSVRMSSSDSIWTIQDFGTDGYPSACRYHQCSGGTGSWVLDPSTLPIVSQAPEPETYAMVLFGFAIVGGVTWYQGWLRRKGPIGAEADGQSV